MGAFQCCSAVSMMMMVGCGTQEQSTQDKEGSARDYKTEEIAKKNEQHFLSPSQMMRIER